MGKKNKGTPQNVEPVQEQQAEESVDEQLGVNPETSQIEDIIEEQLEAEEAAEIEAAELKAENPSTAEVVDEIKINDQIIPVVDVAEIDEEADERAAKIQELTAKVQSAIVKYRQDQLPTSVGVAVLRTVIAKVLGKKPLSVTLDRSGSISIETAEGLKLKV